jgi:hypothetical protein
MLKCAMRFDSGPYRIGAKVLSRFTLRIFTVSCTLLNLPGWKSPSEGGRGCHTHTREGTSDWLFSVSVSILFDLVSPFMQHWYERDADQRGPGDTSQSTGRLRPAGESSVDTHLGYPTSTSLCLCLVLLLRRVASIIKMKGTVLQWTIRLSRPSL